MNSRRSGLATERRRREGAAERPGVAEGDDAVSQHNNRRNAASGMMVTTATTMDVSFDASIGCSTVGTRSTVATTVATTDDDEEERSLIHGMSQLEIEEQQKALRRLQAQKRRAEQRRISASLRNRGEKAPPSSVSAVEVEPQRYTIPDQPEISMLASNDEIVQEQLRILREIESNRERRAERADVNDTTAFEDCKPRARPPSIITTCTDADELNHQLTDQEVIREQQRILDELQQAARSRQTPASSAQQTVAASSYAASASRQDRFLQQPETRTSAAPSTKKSNSSGAYHDATYQLANGTKVRVKGTQHVYRRIQDGHTTVLTQCVTCATVSQVLNAPGKGSNLFYCTVCHQVGPIREMNTSMADADIAAALQSQEKEVAYQHKIR